MTPQGFNAVEICMFYIFLILTSVTTAFGVTETSLSDVENHSVHSPSWFE